MMECPVKSNMGCRGRRCTQRGAVRRDKPLVGDMRDEVALDEGGGDGQRTDAVHLRIDEPLKNSFFGDSDGAAVTGEVIDGKQEIYTTL